MAVSPRTASLSRSMAREPRGIPLPGLDFREAAAARGPRQDSWYGSSGTALSRLLSTRYSATGAAESARVRGRNGDLSDTGEAASLGDDQSHAVGTPAVTDAMEEIIIGSDDRQRIADTQAIPYAWICDLSIIDATGEEWLGTGWLASPRLVITAGHCVYLANQGGWARSITVAPSRDGANEPYTFDALELHSVSGWVNAGQAEYDYGAIILPAEAQNALGYFGFAAFADSDLNGEHVNVVGYPADKPEGTLWGSVRTLDPSLPNILVYDNDTYGGMSGSPVIRWDGSDYLVLGIHNYGDIRGNRATRITAPVFNNIQGWTSRSRDL